MSPNLKTFLCRHSLREVLDAPNVMNMIKDTKAAQEVSWKAQIGYRFSLGPLHGKVVIFGLRICFISSLIFVLTYFLFLVV